MMQENAEPVVAARQPCVHATVFGSCVATVTRDVISSDTVVAEQMRPTFWRYILKLAIRGGQGPSRIIVIAVLVLLSWCLLGPARSNALECGPTGATASGAHILVLEYVRADGES